MGTSLIYLKSRNTNCSIAMFDFIFFNWFWLFSLLALNWAALGCCNIVFLSLNDLLPCSIFPAWMTENCLSSAPLLLKGFILEGTIETIFFYSVWNLKLSTISYLCIGLLWYCCSIGVSCGTFENLFSTCETLCGIGS